MSFQTVRNLYLTLPDLLSLLYSRIYTRRFSLKDSECEKFLSLQELLQNL